MKRRTRHLEDYDENIKYNFRFSEVDSPPLRVIAKLRNLWREQDRLEFLSQIRNRS